MAILLTINGSTGLTFDENNLPAESNTATPSAFTADVVNTSNKYLHGYFEYRYGSGASARLASQDGVPLFAQFDPSGSFPKATIDTWIANATEPPTEIFYVCEVVSDSAIPLDARNFSYLHFDESVPNPFAITMEWDGVKFIPAQSDFTDYDNFEVPPTLNLVSRKPMHPTSGTLSFKVTQDPNQPGYDGITWYNEAVVPTNLVTQHNYCTAYDSIYLQQEDFIVQAGYNPDTSPYTYWVKFWDVSANPTVPALIGTYISPVAPGIPFSVTIAGDQAYVLYPQGTLEIVNIADKSNPAYLGSIDSNDYIKNSHFIGKQGSYLFILGKSSSQSFLVAVDISDPTNPLIYGVPVTLDAYNDGAVYYQGKIFVYYSYDYPATAITALNVYDASNPNNITQISNNHVFGTDAQMARGGNNAVFVDDLMYVFQCDTRHSYGGITVLDISDPTAVQTVVRVAGGPSDINGKIAYDSVSKTAYITAQDGVHVYRLNGADTKYLGFQDQDATDLLLYSVLLYNNRIYRMTRPNFYIGRFVDLAVVDKPVSLDLANDFTSFDQLNAINWLDQWGSDGYVTVKDVVYTPTTRPTGQLTVLGPDEYNYVFYTNSAFPVDTIIIPQNAFTNQGLKNTGSVRVIGHLDLILDDGNGNISRSSAANNTFKIDLLPNAEYPGNDILWWMTQSSSATSIIRGVAFVAEGFEAANPNPLRLLETDASGTVGFKYDPTAVPQDSSALAPSQVVSNIFNNADVELTGYFDAYYIDGGVTKQASIEGNALTVDFQARDSYPRSSFTNWLATFPNTPYSVWYHVGTYQEVTPTTPPEVINVTQNGSVGLSFQIADVPVATNHIDPTVVDTDPINTGSGYFSGYFDYVYDDNGTTRLASDSGLELSHTFTPGSSLPLADYTSWINNAPSTPSEVFFYVTTYSVNPPSGGLPVTPVFDLTIPVVRHYTDGTTPDETADSAHYGSTQYAPEEYYPSGQTSSTRYYVTDAVSNAASVSGLDPNTPYRLVLIGDSVVSVDFTTDNHGDASVNLPSNVEIKNGTITATIYDANNNPIDTCQNPQVWAQSVRVIFIRNDGWCFYGSLPTTASGEISSNANISAGIFTSIVIRSQTTGELIPQGTTFKMLKPGFTHADLNSFAFSTTTETACRELTINLGEGLSIPNSTEQLWELIISETNAAPCGDGMDGIGDTYLDVILNNQADGSATLGIPGLVIVDPNRDTDADGITDLEEDAPDRDTDGDGVEDYRDFDSDNDGIPDFVEGTADADNDGIRAFQDADEGQDHWYNISGVPTEMIPMQDYTFTIEHYVHSRITNGNLTVDVNVPDVINLPESHYEIPGETTQSITMMLTAPDPAACAPAFPENPLIMTITVSYEDATGDTITDVYTYNINRVNETAEFPYKGNKITWVKIPSAARYNIYRKNPDELTYSKIGTVLANNVCSCDNQYYLDREGQPRSFYRIEAEFADGSVTDLSNALRSNNYNINICSIQGVITSVTGRPIKDVTISVRLKKAPTVIDSAGIYKYNQSALTAEDGSFVIDVPQGSRILLTIDDIGLREELLIPLEVAVDLQTLLQLNGSDTLA